MSSLNTNASAMTALQTLAATNKNLATTQSRISTGFRVAEAKDNAAYWSIATTMRSDNAALATVQDALGLGAGKLDTAYTGMNEVLSTVDKIKQKLVAAQGASLTDQNKIAVEIEALQNHIISVATNSNYAGSNLLKNDGTSDGTSNEWEIVASYNRDGTTVSIETIKFDVDEVQLLDDTDANGLVGDVVDSALFDVSSATDPISATDIATALQTVETALAALADGAAKLGAAKSRVDLQKDFVSKLQDAIDRGIGQLVDADMNKESSRLSALQVQQQLGIQALSIANSNTQNILSLFRS